MAVLKTKWSNSYDPLFLEHWGPGSTPGVVSKKKIHFYNRTKRLCFLNYVHCLFYNTTKRLLIMYIVHFTIQQKDFSFNSLMWSFFYDIVILTKNIRLH